MRGNCQPNAIRPDRLSEFNFENSKIFLSNSNDFVTSSIELPK